MSTELTATVVVSFPLAMFYSSMSPYVQVTKLKVHLLIQVWPQENNMLWSFLLYRWIFWICFAHFIRRRKQQR